MSYVVLTEKCLRGAILWVFLAHNPVADVISSCQKYKVISCSIVQQASLYLSVIAQCAVAELYGPALIIPPTNTVNGTSRPMIDVDYLTAHSSQSDISPCKRPRWNTENFTLQKFCGCKTQSAPLDTRVAHWDASASLCPNLFWLLLINYRK